MNNKNGPFSLRSNKKGFLLAEETLKIIVALASILILMGLVIAIYYMYTKDNEKNQAEATLKKLAEAINNGQIEFTAYNPKGKGITAWSDEGLPEICKESGWDNCICISGTLTDLYTGNAVCTQVMKPTRTRLDLASDPMITIDPPLILRIEYAKEKLKDIAIIVKK